MSIVPGERGGKLGIERGEGSEYDRDREEML